MKFLQGLFFASIILFISCTEDEPTVATYAEQDAFIQAHMDSLLENSIIEAYGQDTSGFYYYADSLNPGGKTQIDGNVLSIFYTLSDLEGNVLIKYDSARGDTIVLKQGVGAIYPVAFDHALQYMKEGEEYVFIFPSRLAYAESTLFGLIPANTPVQLRMELLEIRNEDDVLNDELAAIQEYIVENDLKDTVRHPLNQPKILPQGLNMIYKRLGAGVAGTRPVSGDTVYVTYEIKDLSGNQLDTRGAANAFEFIVDEGEVFFGLNVGVKQMEENERALLILPSAVGYTYSAGVVPAISGFLDELVKDKVIPAYAAKVKPYEILLVELQLIDVK